MIAEDHKMFREAIVERISEASTRIEIVGLASNGLELLELLNHSTTDIILLDISMPHMDGWQVLDRIKEDFTGIKTIIFSAEFDSAHVTQAILAGASAYIDKCSGDHNEIIAAIESVSEHGYYFNDIVSQEIILALKKNKQILPLDDEPSFSEREKEVIKQICDGKQVKEIATALHISGSTVKFHKNNVFRKTDSNTNVDLLRYAIRHGIYNVFLHGNDEPPKRVG